jgi:ATP-dependent exoDNAse (exonuclease V) beta subunit
MEAAEKNRLLYVAMTRAEDKLIINGHFSLFRDKYSCTGWLKELIAVLDLEADGLMNGDSQQNLKLPCGQELLISIQTEFQPFYWQKPARDLLQEKDSDTTLAQPLDQLAFETSAIETAILLKKMQYAPQSLVGKLLHLALQSWRFPQSEPETQFLYRAALQFGLVDEHVRVDAVQKVLRYLQRLQRHPLYEEINSADERHHEVPYGIEDQPDDDFGRLDILYRRDDIWKIVDFKTDRISSLQQIEEIRKQRYQEQLMRYARAVQDQLGVTPQAAICYLDVNSRIEMVSIPFM